MAQHRQRTVVVGIDGRSGSGKTTTAAEVARRLAPCPIVSMDELYPGWDGLAAAVPLLTRHVLEPLQHGGRVAYPRYDWHEGRYAETVEVPPSRFVLVEGCGSTCLPARPLIDVRVWLEAPSSLRERRSLERDGEMFAPHWSSWSHQEDAVFDADPPRAHAHLVLETG